MVRKKVKTLFARLSQIASGFSRHAMQVTVVPKCLICIFFICAGIDGVITYITKHCLM